MWDGMNRRRFPRANYRCIITIKNIGEIAKIITTKTQNIGMGGICVVLVNNVDLFKNVELEIVLENGTPPIRCEGSIVWVVKKIDPKDKSSISYDTGVEFVNIKEADRKKIGNIVDKILSSSTT